MAELSSQSQSTGTLAAAHMNPYTQRRTIENYSLLSDTAYNVKEQAASATVPPRHHLTSYKQPTPDEDDDAMIEAYCMEDEDDFPSEDIYDPIVDEEFENIAPPPQQSQNKAIGGATTTTPCINTKQNTATLTHNRNSTISTIFREEENTGDDNYDDKMDTITAPQRSNKQMHQPKKSVLYKFERYIDHSQWRAERMPSPMRAKKWKSSSVHDSIKNTTNSRSVVSSASDSMLLNFLQQRHYGSTIIKKKAPQRLQHCSIPKYPILGKTCLPMTLGDDTRVHVPLKNTNVNKKEACVQINSSSHVTSFGGANMEVLLSRVRFIRRKREHERVGHGTSNEDSISGNSVLESNNIKLEVPVSSESPISVADPSISKMSSSHLWVDKHAPKTFAHLLSDERCNREVVRALRDWDPYVFHREPPKRIVDRRRQVDDIQTTNKAETIKSDQGKISKSKDTRPDESSRVILLSGPPGVGKTTLAHIVARHVGYRPIEVNGSDERTEAALTDRVIRAMESSTLQFESATRTSTSRKDNMYNRPNCLILDEIDGADAAKAIQALVEIIRAEIPIPSAKKKQQYLRRPIIFICNNKYAPALKPLLPYAKQFDIYPPSTTRLITRLRSILTAEDLSLSAGGNSLLNQLVTSSCGDIRSCLYTLQFASTRAYNKKCNTQAHSSSDCISNENPLDSTNIHTIDISIALQSVLTGEGLKDVRIDIVGTITSIFQKEKKRDNFGTSRTMVCRGDLSSSIDNVLEAVCSYGDNSRLLDCMYMNILRVSYIDPSFDRCSAALEWMSSTDIYRSNKQLSTADGHYVDALHTPAVAAAIHILCRVEQPQDLTYSTRDLSDSLYHMESNKALIQKFLDGLCLRARATRTGVFQVSTETIPYTLWILSSGQGSASLQRSVTSVDLLSKGECDAFEQHAAILRTLGLKYVGLVIDNENSNRRISKSLATPKVGLDPPIEKLIKFVDIPNERLDIPPALKQLLSRKAEIERSTSSMVTQTHRQQVPAIKRKTESSVTTASSNFLLLGAKKAKALRSERCAARVGLNNLDITKVPTKMQLGRATTSDHNRLSNTGSGVPLSNVIRLKYVKGFTQAVSTPCRLEDL